jgi:hypothetical protein
MLKKTRATAGVAVALALLAAAPALADVLISHTRSGDFVFTIDVNNGDTQTIVPLDNTGRAQSGSLVVPPNSRFIVSYTAECDADSTFTNARVSVNLDIFAVNQATGVMIALPPTTGDQDAFCTGDNRPGFDGPDMNTVTALAANIPAGTYRIEVRASVTGANGYGTGWLGDSSLIISF